MITLYTQKEYKFAKSKDFLKLKCEKCNSVFFAMKYQIHNVFKGVKNIKLKYCSKKCCDLDKIKKKEVKCLNCGKIFLKSLAQLRHNPNSFCTHSCSSTYNNKLIYNCHRSIGEREKLRIIDGISKWKKIVTKRDIICQKCLRKTKKYDVHHLNSYHWCKNDRINATNGVLLCIDCHKEFHRLFSNKKNTIIQYNKWNWTNPIFDAFLIIKALNYINNS